MAKTFIPRAAFANIHISLFEPDVAIRQILVGTMRQANFLGLTVCHTISEVTEALARGAVDVVMLSLDRSPEESCALVRSIRYNEIGTNPFLVLTGLVSSPDPALAKMILNAGFDDLLVKPVSGGMLIDRTSRFADARKRFVVTSDYIGPDRREKPRDDGAQPITFDPPNPVRTRLRGGFSDRPEMTLDQATAILNTYKMACNGRAVELLAQSVFDLLSGSFDDQTLVKVQAELKKLIAIAEDVKKRAIRGGAYGDAINLCALLIDLVVRLYRETEPDSDFAFSPEDVRLLPELAAAVAKAIGSAETQSTS